jgi:iron(III) transport system ATP-binding protein
MSKDLLVVSGLSKRFEPEEPPVIEDLSFSVEEGEIFALLGPSGCGKTTALRIIAGFERSDAGSVTLDNRLLEGPTRHVPPEKRGIGLVFQDQALFPHLTVFENVRFGLQNLPREQRNTRARKVLDMVGLKQFAERYPHELSGGQQQRVAVARAVAPEPGVILLDEPFSNLDAVLRQTMREDVRNLLREAGMTAVMVTHDQEEALSFADRVGVMRNGRIEQIGTPEWIYYHPRTLFVAQFLGQTNLLLSQSDGSTATTALGRLELDRPAEGSVLVSLRPEHIDLEAAGTNPSEAVATIVAREFKGHDITYRVRFDNSEYLVHTDNRTLFDPGDKVLLRVMEPAVVLEGEQS